MLNGAIHGSRQETYEAHCIIQREATNGKDLADRDNDVAEQEQLHFPVRG
jgi:hypothetical protein